MSITELKLYKKCNCHRTVEIGELYFFENYLIAEFKEGVHIDFENFDETKTLVKKQFGNYPFGFISNRINPYSILVTDGPSFNKEFKNLKAYAVVSHTSISEKIFEIENHFFSFNRKRFNSLQDAINWVEQSLGSNSN